MDAQVVLSTEEIIRGLKHYRRIARQDLLRALETDYPERITQHAEARRAVYSKLTDIAENKTPDDVLAAALEAYSKLPFVTGQDEDQFAEIKGQENAYENFFLMVGLPPKVRRKARSQRPPLKSLLQGNTP